ncbi:MAG TPA: phosphate acetyltransferase [Halanaerobiales bacterium]|nr:phosphate acetyltransferase [Halanaerobiales bacterium]
MNVMKEFKNKARESKKTIVLPEGYEPRMINALPKIKDENLANIILLGEEGKIKEIAAAEGVKLDGVNIINPANSDLKDEFADIFYELRKHKGITKKDALEKILDPLYFGVMLVHTEKADGMVAGSINATGDVLRPALQIVKTKENLSVVSGAMIMDVPETEYGHDGIFIFSDVAVNPNPDAKQLAEIAVSSADTAKLLPGVDPVVAMLSFSTKGSAKHELADKVIEATNIAQDMAPELSIDGELQADAALVPEVGKKKSPDSKVAGRANVLVFPDLQAGNIGYKLVQRLAKASAIGPILQGMAKPVNDLSRGCSVEDIVNVVAITAAQAQNI